MRGLAVHHAIEHWERSRREADPIALYEEGWETHLADIKGRTPDLSQWIKTPRVTTTERDLDLRRQDGKDQVELYCRRAVAEADVWRLYRLPNDELAVELPFHLTEISSKYTVRGYIDGVKQWLGTGALTVVDYKTGNSDREEYRQLGLYRVALQEQYGLDVRFGEYWYSKNDNSSGWIDLERYTLEYFTEQFGQLDAAITAGVFLANPSQKNCLFCGVKQFCHEMRGR